VGHLLEERRNQGERVGNQGDLEDPQGSLSYLLVPFEDRQKEHLVVQEQSKQELQLDTFLVLAFLVLFLVAFSVIELFGDVVVLIELFFVLFVEQEPHKWVC